MHSDALNMPGSTLSLLESMFTPRMWSCLGMGRWLNTSCVSFLLRLLEKDFFLTGQGKSRILLLDPSVVSFLRSNLKVKRN